MVFIHFSKLNGLRTEEEYREWFKKVRVHFSMLSAKVAYFLFQKKFRISKTQTNKDL